jgi:hypothetical protein
MVGFAPVFEALWEGKSVVCKTTGKKFMLPRPTIALVDVSLPVRACSSY